MPLYGYEPLLMAEDIKLILKDFQKEFQTKIDCCAYKHV
jgi:hypothetical protein